jgi:hypothetical protein
LGSFAESVDYGWASSLPKPASSAAESSIGCIRSMGPARAPGRSRAVFRSRHGQAAVVEAIEDFAGTSDQSAGPARGLQPNGRLSSKLEPPTRGMTTIGLRKARQAYKVSKRPLSLRPKRRAHPRRSLRHGFERLSEHPTHLFAEDAKRPHDPKLNLPRTGNGTDRGEAKCAQDLPR